MRVQIDEAGGDDEAGNVHLDIAGERFLRDGHDHGAVDAHIPHRVEAGLRVNDAPAREHDVVAFLRGRRGRGGKGNGQNGQCA